MEQQTSQHSGYTEFNDLDDVILQCASFDHIDASPGPSGDNATSPTRAAAAYPTPSTSGASSSDKPHPQEAAVALGVKRKHPSDRDSPESDGSPSRKIARVGYEFASDSPTRLKLEVESSTPCPPTGPYEFNIGVRGVLVCTFTECSLTH
jgi:hypothetical protein